MTLTETAALTKKAMAITAGVIILGILSWTGYQYYYYNIYLPSIPKPKPVADNKFGILPKINLAPNNISPATYTYSLDTSTGALPKDLPEIMKVYFIPQVGTNLLAPDRARNLASSFGFTIGPEIISPTQYRFKRGGIGGEFIVDLNTSNFNLNFPYTLPQIATPSSSIASSSGDFIPVIADKPTIAEEFKNYLTSKGLLKTQLENGRVNVFYNNGDQKQSNSAEVSIFQNDINEIPIVTPKFTTGLVKGLAIKSSSPATKVEFPILYYTYWPIDKDTTATYFLKKPAQAFADLKNGDARVAIEPKTSEGKPSSSNKVSIINVYLAYILTEEYTPYLQPVYVFEGPEFAAIVPAIQPEYVEK